MYVYIYIYIYIHILSLKVPPTDSSEGTTRHHRAGHAASFSTEIVDPSRSGLRRANDQSHSIADLGTPNLPTNILPTKIA